MIRFHVFVYTPAVFELEAENEREAERKAVALYVKEHGAWIDPKVGLPPTIDIWRIPEVYKGKSMCELGTCDCERGECICCPKPVTYTPKDWERRWIKQLRKKEEDEPEFVTKKKQEMIKLIEEGRSNEIVYDEWGEVYYPIDSDKE